MIFLHMVISRVGVPKVLLHVLLVTMINNLVGYDMEGNLVTLDIGNSWIVIINSVSKNNNLMGMLIRDILLLRYLKGKSCYKWML